MKRSKIKYIVLFSVICVIIDQLIKLLVSNTLIINDSIKIIPNFLYLTHVQNTGAAFSIFTGERLFLIMVSVIAIAFIIYLIKKEKKFSKYKIIYYSLLLGGILGNFMDRLFLGYVVDYIETYIFGYNFPIFNFADSLMFISIFMILIESVRGLNE